MSHNSLSKLDIDVLVHLAVGGPAEAEGRRWSPRTPEPDTLGAQLWLANHAVAGQGEPAPPAYRFVPLPFDPTAAEGVKQVHFYRYQTASDRGLPREIAGFLAELEASLILLVPDVAAAPWGFGPRDLAARAERTPSRLAFPAVEDPRIAELRERLDAAGLPLTIQAPDPTRSATMFGVDAREIVASGHWFPPGTGGFAPVVAVLCDSTQIAQRVYQDRCKDLPRTLHHDRRFYRFGRLVVTTSFSLPHPDPAYGFLDERELAADVAARVARLGDPDESYETQAPPRQDLPVEVLATRVRVSRGADQRAPGRCVVVARTAREIEQASTAIEEPTVAAEIAATSSRKHSILVLWDVDDVGSVESVALYDDPDLDRLVVNASGVRYSTAVVLRVPRLAAGASLTKPIKVTVHDPDHPMNLLAYPPR